MEFAAAGNNDIELTGFDISSVHFAKDPKVKISFVLSDINEGFDEKYHGKFDVVHVGFVVVALQVEQIAPAVQNIVKLLSTLLQAPSSAMTLANLAQNREDISSG